MDSWNENRIGIRVGRRRSCLIVGAVSYRSINKLIDTADWVTHTHKVLENLNGIVLNMVNAETGQRGFVITNDQKYLEPYQYGTVLAVQEAAGSPDLNGGQSRQSKAVWMFWSRWWHMNWRL